MSLLFLLKPHNNNWPSPEAIDWEYEKENIKVRKKIEEEIRIIIKMIHDDWDDDDD